MFLEEAIWIRRTLAGTPLRDGAEALDVGSSTREVRTQIQPWIDEQVFAPLRQRGVHPVHLDIKAADGVDVVCDLTAQGVQPREDLGRDFALVICSNLLEHVTDRPATIGRLRSVVAPGGYLLVTVPRRYKQHHDPIDTMFRPSPAELVAELDGGESALATVADSVVQVRGRATHDTRRLPVRRWIETARWSLPPLRWSQTCVLMRRTEA